MISCTVTRLRSAHCISNTINQPIKQSINQPFKPLINQSIRHYNPLYSAHESRTPINQSHRSGSDTNQRSPETAVRQSRRQKKLEKERARVQSIKKMSFQQYNLELSNRVKQYEDWQSLLLFLAQEMDNTQYNKVTSQYWTSPNKKHEQWTGATIADIINRLIKLRKTRHAVLDDEESMIALNKLCVIIESSVPKLHDELDIWKHLYHPYLYLRDCVDKWNVKRIAKRKAEFLAAQEAKKREWEDLEASEITTESALKRRMQELKEKMSKLKPLAPSEQDTDEPEQNHLAWLFKKDDRKDQSVKQASDKPEPRTSINRRRGEPESVQEIMQRMTNKAKSSGPTQFGREPKLAPDTSRMWVSPAATSKPTASRFEKPSDKTVDEMIKEIIGDKPIEVEEKPKKVKKFFGADAGKSKTKKYFG